MATMSPPFSRKSSGAHLMIKSPTYVWTRAALWVTLDRGFGDVCRHPPGSHAGISAWLLLQPVLGAGWIHSPPTFFLDTVCRVCYNKSSLSSYCLPAVVPPPDCGSRMCGSLTSLLYYLFWGVGSSATPWSNLARPSVVKRTMLGCRWRLCCLTSPSCPGHLSLFCG